MKGVCQRGLPRRLLALLLISYVDPWGLGSHKRWVLRRHQSVARENELRWHLDALDCCQPTLVPVSSATLGAWNMFLPCCLWFCPVVLLGVMASGKSLRPIVSAG